METAKYVESFLKEKKDEWEKRYEEYANGLKKNKEKIPEMRKTFHLPEHLRAYMNLSEAKEGMSISLRYRGENVATLKIKGKDVMFSEKGSEKTSHWNEEQAREFRKSFKNDGKKSKLSEHEIESLLLDIFSKSNEFINNITPVKIADKYDFQFTTPISASGGKIKYSKSPRGGGIDILARKGRGPNSCLWVIELKKGADHAEDVLTQAIAYAVFLQKLLRNGKLGQDWYKLFGLGGKLPKKLKINVVSLTLYDKEESKIEEKLNIDDDELILQNWYFKTEGNKISEIKQYEN
jgi:hypothetical protein